MMKFAIFREVVSDDKKNRKILIEWGEAIILEKLKEHLKKEKTIEKAWEKTKEEFKKESIRIP
jgi:hypothetical protein